MVNALQCYATLPDGDISEFGLQCLSCACTAGQILQGTKDKGFWKALHQIMIMIAVSTSLAYIESRFLPTFLH